MESDDDPDIMDDWLVVGFGLRMSNSPDEITRTPPQAWLDALERGEADLANGLTVPWSELRARLLTDLAEVKAELDQGRA